jgi:ribosomal protein S18 acetylase RimI-like enzyme
MTLEIREATVDEAPAIRALIEEHAQVSFGETELSEDEIRNWFKRPNLTVRVAERDGVLVGYLDVYAEERGHFPADIRTLDREAATVLLEEAERLASEQGAKLVRVFAQGDEPVLREIVADAGGWRPVRYSFQMRIDLDDDLPAPEWPEGLSPRNVQSGEEERVYEADMDGFSENWDFHRTPLEEWRSFAIDDRFDPSLWWLVDDGPELAAVSRNVWHFSGDPRFGWIDSLCVRKQWRRRGLATALLRHSFRDFRKRGATRVGLGVDGENTTGAVALYESVGMRVVRRNDTYEKTL